MPAGVALVTSPEVTTAIVGPDHEVTGKWVLSLETPLGSIIEPQTAVATVEEARELLLDWSTNYEPIVR
jgi:hypothetical protein